MSLRKCKDCGLDDCTDDGGCWDDMAGLYNGPITSETNVPTCECGAEKCQSNIHSSWCPKVGDK